jgi:type 1 fimbria pilin
MNKGLSILATLGFISIHPVHATGQDMAFSVQAQIQPGTCYFTVSSVVFDFQTVYPATIASSDISQRPNKDVTLTASYNTPKNDDPYQNWMGCDPSSTTMNFSVTAPNKAIGPEGQDVIGLETRQGESNMLATNVGISLARVAGTTVTPININGTAVNVGAQGNFVLRATLLPLQNKGAADITGGYINASAVLNITYQ